MRSLCRPWLVCMLVVAGATSGARAVPPAAKSLATLQGVTVTSTASGISVEISASQPITVRSQVTTDPDRLVLDFPNAQPASDLHSKLLNQGDIKGFRVARYSASPPVARVVIDLNSPQHYQIFPDGKTVIVKLMSDQQQAAVQAHLNNVSYTPPPAKPASNLEVEYQNGRLRVVADHVSLAQILTEVHRQTGTDITVPPGGAQEQIVASVGPLPLREALLSLLNGSRFNFIMVDSETEPGKLKSVILTYRGAGGLSQPAIASPQPPGAENSPEPEQPQEPQPEMQPQPEAQPQPQEGQGQQETPQPQDTPVPQ
jgi:AMIN domain